MNERLCAWCTAPVTKPRRGPRAFCDRECYRKWWHATKTGVGNWNWKGGEGISSGGYVILHKGKKYQHRLVMEKILGRPLRRAEIVHHLDGDPKNNDPANLRVMSQAAHLREHNRARSVGPKSCVRCGFVWHSYVERPGRCESCYSRRWDDQQIHRRAEGDGE